MISQRIEGTSAVATRGAPGVPNAYPMLSSRHIRNQTRCSPPPADDNKVRLLHSDARKGATYARLAGIISHGADRGARLLALRFKNAIEGLARHSRARNFERRRAKRFAFDCAGGANLLGGARFLCVARRAVLQRDARRAKTGTRRLHLLGGNKFGQFHRDRALRCGSHARVLELCRRSIDASPSNPVTTPLPQGRGFSRLPPASIAGRSALGQETLREGAIRALRQGKSNRKASLYHSLNGVVLRPKAIILRGTSTRRSSLKFPARPRPTFLPGTFSNVAAYLWLQAGDRNWVRK